MEDGTSIPNQAQLEQNLSQHIRMLYINQLGHEPSSVSCQLADKALTIIVENPVTQPERLLAESGKIELAEQVRANLHKAFQPQIKALIEEVLGIPVIELLGKSNLQTGFSTVIVILAAKPKVDTSS